MSEHIIKRHIKNLLLYHLVCPAKYRGDVFSFDVEETLKNVSIKIGAIYEMNFFEIGTDENHVHFLVQGLPVHSPSRIIQIIKSITAKELFREVLGCFFKTS
jgi:putative transposase